MRRIDDGVSVVNLWIRCSVEVLDRVSGDHIVGDEISFDRCAPLGNKISPDVAPLERDQHVLLVLLGCHS